MLNVQIINKSKHPLPAYATELSAGMDIRANLNEPISLAPMQRCLVPTGLYIALPEGFEAQVRPRSGLAIKKGITVLNSPGTIDANKLTPASPAMQQAGNKMAGVINQGVGSAVDSNMNTAGRAAYRLGNGDFKGFFDTIAGPSTPAAGQPQPVK
jgi:hypothetical protein